MDYERAVQTVYPRGYIFWENDFMTVFPAGDKLVVTIREAPQTDHTDAVRAYLELHAQVFGSGSTSGFRLQFYNELDSLDSAEMAYRLERLMRASWTVTGRVRSIDDRMVALFQGAAG